MRIRFGLMLSLLLLAICAHSQRNADRLINTIKKEDASITVKVPGWLIEKAFDVAAEVEQDEDLDAWNSISESIKQVRVSVVEQATRPETVTKVSEYITKLQAVDNYEVYAKIRQEDTTVDVMVREDRDVIKNILLYVHGEGTLAAIHVKGSIDLKDFEKAQFSWQKNKNEEQR